MTALPVVARAVVETLREFPDLANLDLEAIIRRPTIVTDADCIEAIAIRPMANR